VAVPVHTIFSGPAGGLIGAARLSEILDRGNLIAVDIGGTSTDACVVRDGTPTLKYQAELEKLSPMIPVDSFSHGTTLGLNTVLEHKGAVTGVLTNAGFEDVFEMGRYNRDRRQMYSLEYDVRPPLVAKRIRLGIPCRMNAAGAELQPLDEEAVRAAVRQLVEKWKVRAITVCYLHAYKNPAHEERTAEIIRAEWPEISVAISSAIVREYREYERTSTTVVNAYLRHHRGVTLTEAGEQLREHAERILAEVAKTRVAMSTAAEKPTGTVSLGLPTAMRYVLSSAVISAYHKAYPDVTLKVHEAFAHVIEDLLQKRQVDVAILFSGTLNLDSIDMTPLVTEDVYLAGPPDAGLDLNKPVSVTYLAEVPIILISKRNQLRLAAEQAMARYNCEFQPFLEVEGQPLTHDLVKKGVGYMITPYCAVQAEIESDELSGAPIRGLSITWSIGVSRVRAHAPAVRALIALIQQAVDERVASGTRRNVRPNRDGAAPVRRSTQTLAAAKSPVRGRPETPRRRSTPG
jgi:DNA-binding transcriptional LysR family regulator